MQKQRKMTRTELAAEIASAIAIYQAEIDETQAEAERLYVALEAIRAELATLDGSSPAYVALRPSHQSAQDAYESALVEAGHAASTNRVLIAFLRKQLATHTGE